MDGIRRIPPESLPYVLLDSVHVEKLDELGDVFMVHYHNDPIPTMIVVVRSWPTR